MIQFDPTISLGAVLQIGSLFSAVIGGTFWLGRRLTRMEMKINIMWSWWTRRMKFDDTDLDSIHFFERERVRKGD